MRPVLFKIGSIPIYSYSVMVVTAFFACLVYAYLEARRIGEDKQKVVDLAFYMFITGIGGSRILHVIIEWEHFADDPLSIFKIWRGGLVYYGGFILAIITVFVFVRYHKLPMGKWMDLMAPVAMISLVFGRIGCFLNGCCYGGPAPEWLPWAVVYPKEAMPLKLAGVPLHPTPIYSSLAVALITVFLVFLSRVKRYDGQVFWTMTLLYSTARFILEFFRADPRGGIQALKLSTSQAMGIPVFIISVCILIYLELTRRSSGSQGGPKPVVS